MLKNTEADHPDRPLLQNAIEQISDVASFINDSIKRRENQAKIWGTCVSYLLHVVRATAVDNSQLTSQLSCGARAPETGRHHGYLLVLNSVYNPGLIDNCLFSVRGGSELLYLAFAGHIHACDP